MKKNLALVTFTFAILVAVALCLFGWRWYWAWWTGSSIVTFLLYGFDKIQAKRNGWRVPEVVLHLLVLGGGVAGGWLAMFLFRHKTRHFVFWVVLVLATLLHLALLFWFR